MHTHAQAARRHVCTGFDVAGDAYCFAGADGACDADGSDSDAYGRRADSLGGKKARGVVKRI